MTVKEAINIIMTSVVIKFDIRERISEALMLMQEAMTKQIPKEHHHTRIVNIYCKMRQSICPECLSMINTAENEYPKFCTWCGQALDWGDSDSKDENDYKYLVDARIVKRCDKAFEIFCTEQQGNNDKEDKSNV